MLLVMSLDISPNVKLHDLLHQTVTEPQQKVMLFKGFIRFCFGLFFKLVDFKSNANTEGQVVEDNLGNQKLGQCKLM